MKLHTNLIEIDESTLIASARGALTGVIFFDFGDHQFPEKGWNDRVAIVLSWWLIELLAVLKNKRSKSNLRFMDGPFWVDVYRENNESLMFKCIDGHDDRLEYETILDAEETLFILLSAANKVKTACGKKGIHSSELDELVFAIKNANTYYQIRDHSKLS